MSETETTRDQRISILWRDAFVQAIQSFRSADEEDDLTLDEGAAYGMDATEVADFNAWNRERDFDAEHAAHLAKFHTYVHYLRAEDVEAPDDPDEFRNFQDVEAWMAHDASR